MKTAYTFLAFLALVMLTQTAVVAQTQSLNETIKIHLNQTVQQVKQAESADAKRDIMNESFTNLLKTVDKIESSTALDQEQAQQLALFRNEIQDRSNQLNGLDGYDRVSDEELDEYSDYSQQMMEQSRRVVTIGLTTALLIVIILLLL